MAKNGWKLSKVAITVAFGQKREKVGVGQSNTANNTLCRYCFQAHPFFAKKARGAPVFGHCPKDRLAIAIRSLKDRCVTVVSLTQVLM